MTTSERRPADHGAPTREIHDDPPTIPADVLPVRYDGAALSDAERVALRKARRDLRRVGHRWGGAS